jgi:hypothetical protein
MMTVSSFYQVFVSYYITAILDDPFPSYPMMDEDEDFPEWDYRLHLGNDEKCHFNIPEQILQRDEVGDLGSNSRLPDYQTEDEELSSDQVDHQDQNDSFAELALLSLMTWVLMRQIDHDQVASFLMLLSSFKNSCWGIIHSPLPC